MRVGLGLGRVGERVGNRARVGAGEGIGRVGAGDIGIGGRVAGADGGVGRGGGDVVRTGSPGGDGQRSDVAVVLAVILAIVLAIVLAVAVVVVVDGTEEMVHLLWAIWGTSEIRRYPWGRLLA